MMTSIIGHPSSPWKATSLGRYMLPPTQTATISAVRSTITHPKHSMQLTVDTAALFPTSPPPWWSELYGGHGLPQQEHIFPNHDQHDNRPNPAALTILGWSQQSYQMM